ncbi:MAG: hypothetical protein V4721_10640 [Bacteroidota bacterium]
MYKVSATDANTGLYGINKGAAQVIDTSILQDQAKMKQQEQFAQKQMKSKQEQAREQDIMTNLAAAGNVAIMPKDRGLIAGKSKAVRDFVIKNIDGLKSGDAALQMEYQNLLGDVTTSAEMSKNFREAWEQRGLDIKKDPQAYRTGVLENHLGRAATEDEGNWNIDDSIYKKNINYNDRVVGDLSTYAQRAAQDTPYRKTFTLKQAEEVIASDLENPELFDQAAFDFENAVDKLGAKDPADYYKKKYAPKLVISDTKVGPQGDGSGTKPKRAAVSAVVTNDKGGNTTASINFTDKPDNPYLTIDNPGVLGETIELRPMAVVRKPDGKIVLRGSTKASGEGANRTEGKIMEVDYSDVADVMNNTFGIENPISLLEGSVPEHVSLKKYDIDTRSAKPSPTDFNTKWAQLKKGQSLVGPDGKTYTKK